MVKDHKEGLVKPGNEDYLSYYKPQGECAPSKPVGTIGAMLIGPGPAVVNLPPTIGDKNHDPTKKKAPAYRVGERDMRQSFSCGPGPAAYDVRKITNRGVDECHAPKVGDLLEGLVPFRSPGPAVYNRGDSDFYVYPKSPSYSMRPKPKERKTFRAPAPDSYTLPETLGPGRAPFAGGPAYTIAERMDKTGIFQPNPGPLAYQLPPPHVTRHKQPAYTMGSKLGELTVGTTPGPASNECHMVKYHKPATPRFTFGIRHTPFQAFQKFAAEN